MEREQPVKDDTITDGRLSETRKPPAEGKLSSDGTTAEKAKMSPDDNSAARAWLCGEGKPPAKAGLSGEGKSPAKTEPPADERGRKPKKKKNADKDGLMKRNTAREIAVHLAYELSFTDRTAEALLAERLSADTFASLAEEDSLYATAPDELQIRYITRLVSGVSSHAAELDGYIEKYAVGWSFARIPLMASAIMRTAMYEILYMPEIPNASAVNSAVDIAKKYETPETVRFINGILGSFSRQEL